MAAVTLKEAIAEIERGQWLQLRYITANISKGQGGMVIELPKCRIARNRSVAPARPVAALASRVRKNPNHSVNFTINLELPDSSQVRKVHPLLITHINQNPVI